MALKYDFYTNPVPPGSEREPRLHARVVTTETIGTDKIAEEIQYMSSLTTGDVIAALDLVVKQLAHHLSYGERVHIEGLGYFQLTLSCPAVKSPKEIRAESVKVKTIAFRPDESFKECFINVTPERVRVKNHSQAITEKEIDNRLTAYFRKKEHITTAKFRSLCGLTQPTAERRIRQRIKDGKLRRIGHARSSLYVPVKGFYGK